MSKNFRVYTKALYGFDHVVRSMPRAAWSSPSPCEGWTARDVLGHVIAVQGYVESLARGIEPRRRSTTSSHGTSSTRWHTHGTSHGLAMSMITSMTTWSRMRLRKHIP
jgi:hypothetical protein